MEKERAPPTEVGAHRAVPQNPTVPREMNKSNLLVRRLRGHFRFVPQWGYLDGTAKGEIKPLFQNGFRGVGTKWQASKATRTWELDEKPGRKQPPQAPRPVPIPKRAGAGSPAAACGQGTCDYRQVRN